MTMDVGDVVNITKYGGGYWKGKITSVSDRFDDVEKCGQPIAVVHGVDGWGVAAVIEKNLRREDGEFFEVRI